MNIKEFQRENSVRGTYIDLCRAVRAAGVFSDSKTFVDCVPRRPLNEILADFAHMEENSPQGFSLGKFIEDNFIIPVTTHFEAAPSENIEHYIRSLWRALRRNPDQECAESSLLALPFPYIVPGGRFREIYYWDSYFTMLGLRESNEEELIEGMADNFAFLAARHGMIPNGNRSYYLSRSQPPVFALIVELIAERNGADAYRKYLPTLESEYAYWMDQAGTTIHCCKLPSGELLNRYYDQYDVPRPEAFFEDEEVGYRAGQGRKAVMRNLRSAAESGWDFSSRWFGEGGGLGSIRTTELLPVDLNCLLFQLETSLASAYAAIGEIERKQRAEAAAAKRKQAIQKVFWSAEMGWFCDYDITSDKTSAQLSIAGMFPLFFKLATREQAETVVALLVEKFVRPGGVVTTLTTSGEQWDAPNGWAPLQWITICGLKNYGYTDLARAIAQRWIKLNCDVYRRTGKIMEKYNVVDLSLEAGGGEYPSQDGFGWTNGVLQRLLKDYPLAK